MNKRVFDESFTQMAVELSYTRGSAKEVADEPGIDPGRLSKWRNRGNPPAPSTAELIEEQREIKRLQKELKEAQLERDILKKTTSIFPRETGGIRICSRAPVSISHREDGPGTEDKYQWILSLAQTYGNYSSGASLFT